MERTGDHGAGAGVALCQVQHAGGERAVVVARAARVWFRTTGRAAPASSRATCRGGTGCRRAACRCRGCRATRGIAIRCERCVVEQRVNLIRHVAVVAEAARRVGGVVGVFDQALAISLMAGIAGRVGPHAVLHLMIGIALVHGMAGEAAQLAVTALVARRQRHALVFQRRRQRRAVAPEAAVGPLGTRRPRCRGVLSFLQASLFRLGPDHDKEPRPVPARRGTDRPPCRGSRHRAAPPAGRRDSARSTSSERGTESRAGLTMVGSAAPE